MKQTKCFMPGRSRTLQLLRTVKDWTVEQDNGNEVDIVYIDFQTASDSLPQKKVLGIKAKCDIQSAVLNWSREFKFGRKQRVVINKSYWKRATVGSGIPQDSIIGPVLFLIFEGSMFNCVSAKKYIFADDAEK